MDNPKPIKDILKSVGNVKRNNVNDENVDIKITTNVNNVDELTTDDLLNLLGKRLSDQKDKNLALAETLSEKLDDKKDLNYFKTIVKTYPESLLWECLSITLTAKREGKIKKAPAKYFVGVLKFKTRQRGLK